MTPTKHDIARFAALSTEQLEAWWNGIGSDPDHRVKSGPSKGQLKMSVIKQSDKLLAEIGRRNATLKTEN